MNYADGILSEYNRGPIMPVAIGTQLGSHEVTALLGKGGMGEVYRARDLKLKREVAIKILPDEFSFDTDRVSRFQREAEMLASLNHPNIAGIYDVQEAQGVRFLVLELVEGETLADRIARGPIPVDEALGIAMQICEALEGAHDKGIIHRDLKPSNVKMTPEGQVKVLDFGLAKAMESTTANASVSHSPTLLTGSMGGMIVGTAAYMSPEQARGRTADQRSDVFAFGCVLYEMLTGRQAFHGEDVSDILASVMKIDADYSQLPRDLNPRLTELLRRCLAKNRKDRWYAIGDIRVEIKAILTEPPRVEVVAAAAANVKQPFWKRVIPAIVAALLAATATAAVMWFQRPSPQPGHVARYFFTLPKDQEFTRSGRQILAISHDGTHMAYVANSQLYLKSLADVDAKAISGTNQDVTSPMFSPDGQWIAFVAVPERRLKKIPLAGGASVTLAEGIDNPYGASWSTDDQIFLGQGNKGIFRVAAAGGKPEVVIAPNPKEWIDGPQLLPNGELLFTVASSSSILDARWDTAQVVAQNLKTGERKILVQAGSEARYISDGHLLYAVGATLYAVPFDLKKMQVTGGPVPVLEGVRRSAGQTTAAAFFSVSDEGALVFVPGAVSAINRRILTLVDRSGVKNTLPLSAAPYDAPRLSPDGKQLAVGIIDVKETNIWVYDLGGNTSIRRLTFGGKNQSPAWTPDGKRIAFRSDRDGEGIYWQAADGSGAAERLTKTDKVYDAPVDWTPDGKVVAFFKSDGGGGSVWTLALDGDRKPQPLLQGANSSPSENMRRVSFSPDGRWIAYASNEETDFNIYVQPFPLTGSKYRISKGRGDSPLWTRDGKQIIFVSGRRLMSVDVQTKPAFTFSEPKPLPIEIENTQGRPYDITPDGKQFLIMERPPESETVEKASTQINVVLNWVEELKQRLPVK
jgi:serine/threonine protein kinase/Tol biopolymer transport system component